MMRIRTMGAVVALVAVGAACEADADMEETFPGAEQTTEAPAMTPAPTTETESASGALQVQTLAGAGAYVTDAAGRALYLLEGEPADSSTCYDACAEEWPPFLAADAAPDADAESLRSDLIGTIERRDGQTQVTYAGHPLYYYHDDEGPGDTAGQDLTDQWGEWYLVQPSGEPLEAEAGT